MRSNEKKFNFLTDIFAGKLLTSNRSRYHSVPLRKRLSDLLILAVEETNIKQGP